MIDTDEINQLKKGVFSNLLLFLSICKQNRSKWIKTLLIGSLPSFTVFIVSIIFPLNNKNIWYGVNNIFFSFSSVIIAFYAQKQLNIHFNLEFTNSIKTYFVFAFISAILSLICFINKYFLAIPDLISFAMQIIVAYLNIIILNYVLLTKCEQSINIKDIIAITNKNIFTAIKISFSLIFCVLILIIPLVIVSLFYKSILFNKIVFYFLISLFIPMFTPLYILRVKIFGNVINSDNKS